MRIRKLNFSYLHEWPEGADLKGTCLLLPGTLNAAVEAEELPKHAAAALPSVLLCLRCDAYLERLLNERGVAVTSTLDPVDAIPDGAEVHVDLLAGTLIEQSSGRRFAIRPLKPSHFEFVRSHG